MNFYGSESQGITNCLSHEKLRNFSLQNIQKIYKFVFKLTLQKFNKKKSPNYSKLSKFKIINLNFQALRNNAAR